MRSEPSGDGLREEAGPRQLSAIYVHYRTPALLGESIDSLRPELERSGLRSEIVVVDNGSEPGQLAPIAERGAKLLTPGENLGYAAGLDLGVQHSSGPVLLLMNPDVLLAPGCLGALLDALPVGPAAVGPKLFWNRGRDLVLPPTERATRRELLMRAMASRGRRWATWARRRWRHHAQRHWLASSPIASFDLSGCMLAVTRAAWQRVGPFDPGYRLYFEETDWLLRLQKAGGRAHYVPQARAVHLFEQSATSETSAPAWFATSQRRFEERHYPAWLIGVRDRLARPARGESLPPEQAGPLELPRGAAWLEVSRSEAGFPAAGYRLTSDSARWQLPSTLARRLAGAELFLRACDHRGRDLLFRRLRPAPLDA